MLDFINRADIIDEKNYSQLMETQVEPYLEKKRESGYFICRDGNKMYYEAYKRKLTRGNIVILHGFTESAEKFREAAYYFCKAGYSVFSFDMRGHGKSYRSSDKKERVDIDSFDTYAEDLNCFMTDVVKSQSGKARTYIYSHSLGSTVALLYMMKYKSCADKAVLSSPMICGNMGMPVAVASAASKLICFAGGRNVPAPGRCVFDFSLTADRSDAVSGARFDYYHTKRKNEPLYQTSGPSFGWVKASVEAKDSIMAYDFSRCGTELMIFRPEEDKQLLSEYTDAFAEKNGIKIKNVKNSKHEIFMSCDDVLSWYYGEILEFFDEIKDFIDRID